MKEIFTATDQIRKALGVRTIEGFTRYAVTQDIYDDVFLKTPEDPWSTVMVNKRERYASTHLWRERSAEFLVNDVFNKTGMSFPEFLKLPTFMVEHILDTLREMNATTRSGANTMEKELEKQVQQEFGHIKPR